MTYSKPSQATKDKYVGNVFPSNNYGDFEILEYNAANDVVIKFLQTGWVDTVFISQVGTGSVRDYMQPTIRGIGITEGRLSKDEMNHKACKNWQRVVIRCYDEKQQEKQPTYKGCWVSDYFLKYYNFKEWYIKQPNWENPNYVLDKDLLSPKGAKVYSPETCVFLPKEVNSLLTTTKAKRGELPVGVCLRAKDTKYSATCCINGVDKHLGLYSTVEEAFSVYKKTREDYLKSKAEKYKDELDVRAYEALMKYEVEITD